MSTATHPSRVAIALMAVATLVVACTSNETITDPDPDNPTLSLAISPTSASVAQGGSTTFEATATLGGNFTGAVTFSVSGLPTGVTVTVGSVASTGNTATATVTIAAAASVAPGSYPGTVTATGSGVSDTETYTLDVTAAPSYVLAATPATISIDRGSTGDVAIALTRTNFTAAVTLAAESLPTGVTAAFSPAAPSGATSTLTLTVGPGATAATNTVTVRGTATGLTDVTTTFDLTVTIPPVPDLTIDFSQCVAEEKPIWVAAADGMAGAWATINGTNDAYGITGRTQSTLGLTLVYANGSTTEVGVQYLDATGLSGQVDVCAGNGNKTVNGTAVGFNGIAAIALGSAWTTAFPSQPFILSGVRDGPLPLVGYAMSDPVTGAGQMLIRRDQNIIDNGSLGTLDFAAEGFAPASATISIANLGGDQGFAEMAYAIPMSGNLCGWGGLYQVPAAASFTGYSAPVAQQQAGELHVVDVSVAGNTAIREVSEAFATLAARTVTLPSELPLPTLTDATAGGAYLRLQAELTIPSEYDHDFTFGYEAGTQSIFISYVGGLVSGAVSTVPPDFSALAGWDNNWAPAAGATGVDYLVSGSSREADLLETNPYYCTDGGRYVFGANTGTYN